MNNNLDKKKKCRQLRGKVVSNKMEKTIVVEVKRIKAHPLYRKRYAVSLRMKADDPKKEAKIGDTVLIEQCRPISHDKHYRLKKIVN